MAPNRRSAIARAPRRTQRQTRSNTQAAASPALKPSSSPPNAADGAADQDGTGLLGAAFALHQPSQLNVADAPSGLDAASPDGGESVYQDCGPSPSSEPEDIKDVASGDDDCIVLALSTTSTATSSHSTRPPPAALQSVDIHSANISRFSDEEMILIHEEKAGSFHINGDGRAARGTIRRPPLIFPDGIQLLWQVGCFSKKGSAYSSLDEMARQAVRRSYKLEVDSDDEKFTIGAARNSIGKRVVKKMCEWFGCEKWRQLPEDLNITRNNHLFNIDGILRPYLEPETVRLLDVEDSEKFLGHRNYDEGSAPRRFEIGYTPPAASQKKKRSSIKKRTKLSADTAFHDDFADEDVKVQPMPQKKRRNGRSVAGNRKQELQPEHHEATTPHEAPGPAATMQAEHDDQIDPQLYDEGELRPISSASEHFPVDQQLTHAMADYSGSNAEGKLNGMIGPSQTSYEAMISNDHDNNIDNGNHASSPPMYPEMAPATHPPEFVESTIQPYGASRVPEPRMSYWSQLMPTYQTADGLGSPSITDTMAPANHFSDAELRSQRLIMQHYGPIRDASGMIVTNFAHYAMLVLQNGLHPGLF